MTDSMTYGDLLYTADFAYLYGYKVISSRHLRILRIQL